MAKHRRQQWDAKSRTEASAVGKEGGIGRHGLSSQNFVNNMRFCKGYLMEFVENIFIFYIYKTLDFRFHLLHRN